MIAMKKWQMELNGQNMLCYAGDRRCAELSVKTDLPQSWHCQLGLRSKESVAFYPLEWEDGYLHASLTEHELPCDGWYELQILGIRGAVQKSTEPFRVYICRADDGARQAAEQARRKAKEAGNQAEMAEKARRGAEQAVGHTSASATAAKHAALMAQQAKDAARSAQEQTAQHMQQAAESAARAEAYKADALGYKKEAARSAQEAAAQVEKINERDSYTKIEMDAMLGQKTDAVWGTFCAVSPYLEDSARGELEIRAIFGNTVQDSEPTPTAPAEMQYVESPVMLNVCGKNCLPFPYAINDGYTVNGLMFTVNEDQSIAISGTATATTSIRILTDAAICAGSYYFSGCPEGGSSTTYRMYVSDGKNLVVDFGDGAAIKTETNNIAVGLVVVSGTNMTGKTIYPQIESGESKSWYEPYDGASYSIPLVDGDGTEYTLRKVKNVQDIMERDANGKYQIFQGCGEISFDGTEAWSYNSAVPYFAIDIAGRAGTSNLMCSHFQNGSGKKSNKINGSIGERIYVYADIENVTDLPSWKAWLAEQKAAGTPVTVQYQFAEPVTVDLCDETQKSLKSIQSKDGVTNLFGSSKQISPAVAGEYRISMWKHIEKLEAALAAVGGI